MVHWSGRFLWHIHIQVLAEKPNVSSVCTMELKHVSKETTTIFDGVLYLKHFRLAPPRSNPPIEKVAADPLNKRQGIKNLKRVQYRNK